MKFFRTRFVRFVVTVMLGPLMVLTGPRDAQAVIPIPLAIGIAVVGAAGIIAAQAMIPGTVANALVYGDGQPTSRAAGFADVPLGTRDRSHLDTPTGWASPTSPPTVAATMVWWANGSGYNVHGFASGTDACSALCSAIPGCTGPSFSGTDTCKGTRSGMFQSIGDAGSQLGCGAGYTLSGSNCVVSDATQVAKPADNRCQVLATVAGFTVDPQDSECSGLASAGVTVGSNFVQAKRKDGTTHTVTINGDGSRTVVDTSISADGKSTVVNTITLAPNTVNGQAVQDGSATITGSRSEVIPGTGVLATVTPAVTPIQFPTDYARDATVQTTNTDAANDRVLSQTTAAGMPKAPDPQTDLIPLLPKHSDFSPFSFPIDQKMPAGSGGCVPLDASIPILGALHLDPCSLVPTIVGYLNWMVIILGVMSGASVILMRNQE